MQDRAFRRIVKGHLERRSRSPVVLQTQTPTPGPSRRPARIAKMIALAHHIQTGIDRGELGDRASVARALKLTRARVTQLLDLLLLAPDIQAKLLELEAVDGVEPLAERRLRCLARQPRWDLQREGFAAFSVSCICEN